MGLKLYFVDTGTVLSILSVDYDCQICLYQATKAISGLLQGNWFFGIFRIIQARFAIFVILALFFHFQTVKWVFLRKLILCNF